MTNPNAKVVWFFKNFIKIFKNRGINKDKRSYVLLNGRQGVPELCVLDTRRWEFRNHKKILNGKMKNWKNNFREILIFDKGIKKYQSSKIASSYRLTLSATFLASLTSYVNFFAIWQPSTTWKNHGIWDFGPASKFYLNSCVTNVKQPQCFVLYLHEVNTLQQKLLQQDFLKSKVRCHR